MAGGGDMVNFLQGELGACHTKVILYIQVSMFHVKIYLQKYLLVGKTVKKPLFSAGGRGRGSANSNTNSPVIV